MLNSKKIAVLGGGNGGHAMAADLTLKGYEVDIGESPEFKDSFALTIERQAIGYIDAYGNQRTVKVAKATTDIAEAVKDAKYIMIAAPAVGALNFFDAILPCLENGQTVIKWSGNFSALVFARMLREKGNGAKVTIAESHTLPWGCRLVAPGVVQVMLWASRLLLAALPARNITEVIEDIQKIYPVVPGENVLASTFNNLNPVVHPVGTILNTGWIETVGKDFYLYRDGNTLGVSRCIKIVFEEVCSLAKSLNVPMLEYPEEDFWKKSAIMGTYFRAVFDKDGMTGKISGPSSMTSRYITEDLPQGLVPMAHLARKFNVSTPLLDSIITIASIINQTDYIKDGLSLEELGISGMNKKEITQYLREGNL